MSEIQKWYSGKNVLITGATGFVGKVLVERLLRDCDEVNCIYLIVRGKNDFKARCQEFLNNIAFDYLRQTKPKQLERIKIFQGDLTQENFGLNTENLNEILDNIEIVVHSAADVRFDLSLRDIFTTNTVGIYRFLELAKRITKLKIFVFVSTAYSQSHQKVTEERHYDGEIDAFKLMKALDRFDDHTMFALQSKFNTLILKEFPNTYSFSKHLSEVIVHKYRNELPICVVRPSIVSAALKYPMPGYTEGLNGFNGLCFATLRGVMRTMYCKESFLIQTIPVDVVANTIIITSWIHGRKKRADIEYYNTNMPNKLMCTFEENVILGRKMRFEYPLNYSIWSPNNTLTYCAYYFYIRVFFYQLLPSFVLDLLIWILRRKPVLVKIQRKIYNGVNLVTPYLKIMKIETNKFNNIENYLNTVDRARFVSNFDAVTPEIFVRTNAHGIRKFIAKEKDEDLPRAKRNNLMYSWYWIHVSVQLIVATYLLILYLTNYIHKFI